MEEVMGMGLAYEYNLISKMSHEGGFLWLA